jgi:hypothetical protein
MKCSICTSKDKKLYPIEVKDMKNNGYKTIFVCINCFNHYHTTKIL